MSFRPAECGYRKLEDNEHAADARESSSTYSHSYHVLSPSARSDDDDGEAGGRWGRGGSQADSEQTQWEEEVEVEAAALAVEAQITSLRSLPQWRMNTRQYRGNTRLEDSHATWALKHTLSTMTHTHAHACAHTHTHTCAHTPRDTLSTQSLAHTQNAHTADVVSNGARTPTDIHTHAHAYTPTRTHTHTGVSGSVWSGGSGRVSAGRRTAIITSRASQVWSRSASLASLRQRHHHPTHPRTDTQHTPTHTTNGWEGWGGGGSSLGWLPLSPQPINTIYSSNMDGVGHRPGDGGGGGGGGDINDGGTHTPTDTSAHATHPHPHPSLPSPPHTTLHELLLSHPHRPPPTLSQACDTRVLAFLAAADYMTSLLLFSILSITWGRGVWNLLNLLVLPENRPLRCAVLTAVGYSANVLGFLLYAPLREWGRRCADKREARLYGAAKRGAILVRMMGTACAWTGIWDGIDGAYCVPGSPGCSSTFTGLWLITASGVLALILMRQLNYSMGGPPFGLVLDYQCELVLDTTLVLGTDRKRVMSMRDVCAHACDIALTHIVPDLASMLAWYGVYTWFPLAFPGKAPSDHLLYFSTALVLAAMCYAAQFLLARLVDIGRRGGRRCGKVVKYAVEVTHFIVTLMVINVLWVTWWNILDALLLPSRPLLSNGLCAAGGLSLMFALNIASSEVGAGVYLDGSSDGASGLFFPICYWPEVLSYLELLGPLSNKASTDLLHEHAAATIGGPLSANGGITPQRPLLTTRHTHSSINYSPPHTRILNPRDTHNGRASTGRGERGRDPHTQTHQGGGYHGGGGSVRGGGSFVKDDDTSVELYGEGSGAHVWQQPLKTPSPFRTQGSVDV